MKLSTIINIADKVYPDGLVKQAFEEYSDNIRPRSVGDGLAEFIARELADTYDPKATSLDQIGEACRVMSRAHTEIGDVSMALSDYESKLIHQLRAKATTPRPKRKSK